MPSLNRSHITLTVHRGLHNDLTPTHYGIGSETSNLKPTGFNKLYRFTFTRVCASHQHPQRGPLLPTNPHGAMLQRADKAKEDAQRAGVKRVREWLEERLPGEEKDEDDG